LTIISPDDIIAFVIESFASEETEKIFHGEVSRKLPTDIQRIARRKLIYLEDAETLLDVQAVPGNNLEKLKGGRAGQFSIRINEQWRICFDWVANNARNVEIVDYHKRKK
jgi:proteic killer suppression protein